MKLFFIYSFLIFCTSVSFVSAQSKDTLSVYYYNKGLSAFAVNDLETAKDLFKKSVREEANAPAEYELAKVYMADTSHSMWNISRAHIKNAVKLDPNNASYRVFYGKLSEALYKTYWIEFAAHSDAVKQYEMALQLDSSLFIVSKWLGEIKLKEFFEFNNSVEKFSDATDLLRAVRSVQKTLNNETSGNTRSQQLYDLKNIVKSHFNKSVQEYFNYAEKAFVNAVKYDSLNSDLYFKLCSMYEENNQPEKGIKYLQHLTKILPENKNARLELGLLYYRSNQPDSAYAEFTKAILLMSDSECEDFTFNSVKVLIAPFLKNEIEYLDENTLKKIISFFWKARDPLNLTQYNERLLEHYSRVAYSNLRFSIPDLNITGWNTDRGITVIRYGIPPKRIRFRPGINLTGQEGIMKIFQDDKIEIYKTDVWIYRDKTFSFTDDFKNGNFRYAKPNNTQYYGDTQVFANNLLATQPDDYAPVFNGPIFNVPYKALQFKNLTRNNLTDVYVSYGIKTNNATPKESNYKYAHKIGIYFFDKYFNKTATNENIIEYLNAQNQIVIPDSGNFIVNSIGMKALPDSGNLSFEIFRTEDSGVATYHRKYEIKNFNAKSLTLSDILLASNINVNSDEGTIKRKDISILPNPTGIFSKAQELYIYYEVYNLDKNAKGLTDFKQNIILQKKNDKGIIGKVFSPVLKIVGINSEEKQVSLTSNYQTQDKDSQIYLQLDMTGYERGDYVLTIKIKDNIAGKETEQSTELTWK